MAGRKSNNRRKRKDPPPPHPQNNNKSCSHTSSTTRTTRASREREEKRLLSLIQDAIDANDATTTSDDDEEDHSSAAGADAGGGAAAAAPESDFTDKEQMESIRKKCIEELYSVKTSRNAHVIDFFVEHILPQLRPNILIPLWIALCPTPIHRSDENLEGHGKINENVEDQCKSVRNMVFLDQCLPDSESGGIKGGALQNSWLTQARSKCSNDGIECNKCRHYSSEEARDIGNALVIISKYVRRVGARIVAMSVAGLTVGVDKLFKILQDEGQFDGLSVLGVHAQHYSHKAMAWSKHIQSTHTRSSLHNCDQALAPSYTAIGFKPKRTLLKAAELEPSFNYVVPNEEEMTKEDDAVLANALKKRLAEKEEGAKKRTAENDAKNDAKATAIMNKPKNEQDEQDIAWLAGHKTAVTRVERAAKKRVKKSKAAEAAQLAAERKRVKEAENVAKATAIMNKPKKEQDEQDTVWLAGHKTAVKQVEAAQLAVERAAERKRVKESKAEEVAQLTAKRKRVKESKAAEKKLAKESKAAIDAERKAAWKDTLDSKAKKTILNTDYITSLLKANGGGKKKKLKYAE